MIFFFSSRRRHTRCSRDWSSDVCSSDLERGGGIGWRSTVLLEVSEALTEGQLAGQLNKAQEIAALTTTVAVEEIFAGVDIEGGTGFRVQGTESDELGAMTSRPEDPVLLPQIIEQ